MFTLLTRSHGRTEVRSSNLRSVGYDEWTAELEIEFHGGRVYRYFDVPVETFEGLMEASSHGRYFHRHIKHRFKYQRLR